METPLPRAARRPYPRCCYTLLLALPLLAACQGGRAPATQEGAAPTAPPPPPGVVANGFAPAQTGLCGAERHLEPFAAGPDRLPFVSEVLRRGGLAVQSVAAAPASAPPSAVAARRVDDASIADWVGASPMLGGLALYDRGEHIYRDFLYDAWGADDGSDAQRYAINEGLQQAVTRAERLDQLFQALGDQFGAPAPVGAADHYGDATDITGPQDLLELRWAADAQDLYLLARYSRLVPGDRPVLAIALDGPEALEAEVELPGLGLRSARFERLLIVARDAAWLLDTASGTLLPTPGLAWQWLEQDMDNALELRLPRALAGVAATDALGVAVLSAREDTAGTADGPGLYTPANLAYRYDALEGGALRLPCDPVAGIYNERAQAFDLLAGQIDGYALTLDLAGLQAGRTESVQPTGGYYERHFLSDPEISHEDPLALDIVDGSDPFEPWEQTQAQAYGLYLPPDYDPQAQYPMTVWLHYRGGKTHSAGAWSPRIVHQHGLERGAIVVTPRGRGSKSWYEGASHRDVWEVLADIAGTDYTRGDGLAEGHGFASQGFARIDPRRVTLSGYSMGGHGTYMFGLLYPDRFAAGYSSAGVHFGSALPGGQNLLRNARHLPLVIQHGSFDELVPWVSIAPVATTLQELGYRYQFDTFPGYEHYTQAIIDEWADGTRYLDRQALPENPRRISYQLVPEFVRQINRNNGEFPGSGTRRVFDFRPDGAWWVDDIAAADDGGCDVAGETACDESIAAVVEAESFALPGQLWQPQPVILEIDNGLGLPSTPVASPGNHSTPYTRLAQDWVDGGDAPQENRLQLQLSNVGQLSLDLPRSGLDLDAGARITLQADAALRLGLRGAPAGLQVLADGAALPLQRSGEVAWADVPAGSNELTLRRP